MSPQPAVSRPLLTFFRPSLFWGGLVLLFLPILAEPLRAADTGQFQLIIAAPDPIVGGEKVQFQVIAVNQGTEQWRARKYYLEAEIFDSNEQYLARTDRVRGLQDVGPGQTVLSTLDFSVPVTYAGEYRYKVYLVNNGQRVMASELKSFRVKARPILTPKPPPVALGGNVVASYRNETGAEEYVGNLSINLVGRLEEKSFLFNAYTFHDPNDSIDVFTILFNYYGPKLTAGLGDVSPSFSPLSLSGQGMRGATAETNLELGQLNWTVTAVGARTVTSEEGDATTDGVFRRMLYGGKGEVSLGRLTLSGSYVNSFDEKSSLDVTGPTLTPVDDKVAGGQVTWEIFTGMKIGGEYQASSFQANEESTAPAVTDNAWRGFLALEFEKFSLNGYVQRTGTDFVSLGAPNVTQDRLTQDASLSVYPLNWMSLYGSYNHYTDNLEDDPSLVTTDQSIINSGITFNLPTLTSLNLGYSLNQAVGDPDTAQDNETLTTSVGLSQALGRQSVSVSYQTSDFQDKTKSTNDLVTNTFGGSVGLIWGSRFSSSLSATLSNTDDQVDNSIQKTETFSASLNIDIVQDRLVAQIWGTRTSTEDDDVASPSETEDTTANVEMTWQASSSMSLTLGAFRNDTKDKLTPANDIDSTGGNARISYSF